MEQAGLTLLLLSHPAHCPDAPRPLHVLRIFQISDTTASSRRNVSEKRRAAQNSKCFRLRVGTPCPTDPHYAAKDPIQLEAKQYQLDLLAAAAQLGWLLHRPARGARRTNSDPSLKPPSRTSAHGPGLPTATGGPASSSPEGLTRAPSSRPPRSSASSTAPASR